MTVLWAADAKPIIYATNVSEDDLAEGTACTEVMELAAQEGAETKKISAQWKRSQELGDEETADYLKASG